MSISSKEKLVAAIYEIMLSQDGEPSALADVEAIFNRIATDYPVDILADLAQDIAYHVDIASRIASQQAGAIYQQTQLRSALDAIPNPSYLIDSSETVLAVNHLARKIDIYEPGKIADCIQNDDILADIRNFMVNSKSQDPFVGPGYVDRDGRVHTSVIMRRLNAEYDTGSREDRYLLTIVDFGFDDQTLHLFEQAYELTNTEAKVAALLAGGMQHSEIAQQRSVSLQTVRSQVKTIKNKTNTRDIPGLVRLMCGFSSGIQMPAQLQGNLADSTQSTKLTEQALLTMCRNLKEHAGELQKNVG